MAVSLLDTQQEKIRKAHYLSLLESTQDQLRKAITLLP
tara:strand:+ start:303 stop:416 length:114 start_codon:yes stop_codon:yes gene_type:complete